MAVGACCETLLHRTRQAADGNGRAASAGLGGLRLQLVFLQKCTRNCYHVHTQVPPCARPQLAHASATMCSSTACTRESRHKTNAHTR
eukprot:366441-Chlamydomonas_euryale.AAC.29